MRIKKVKDAPEVRKGEWYVDKANRRLVYIHNVEKTSNGYRIAFMTQKAGSSAVSSMQGGNVTPEQFARLGYIKVGSRAEANAMLKAKDSKAVFTKDELKNLHRFCDAVKMKDIDYRVGGWYGSRERQLNVSYALNITGKKETPYGARYEGIPYYIGFDNGGYVLKKDAAKTMDQASLQRYFPTVFGSKEEAVKWLKMKSMSNKDLAEQKRQYKGDSKMKDAEKQTFAYKDVPAIKAIFKSKGLTEVNDIDGLYKGPINPKAWTEMGGSMVMGAGFNSSETRDMMAKHLRSVCTNRISVGSDFLRGKYGGRTFWLNIEQPSKRDSKAVLTKDEISNFHKFCDSVKMKDIDYAAGQWYGSENPLAIARIVRTDHELIHTEQTSPDAFNPSKLTKESRAYPLKKFSSLFKTAFSTGGQASEWIRRRMKVAKKDSKVNDIDYQAGKFYGGMHPISGKPTLIQIISLDRNGDGGRTYEFTYNPKTGNIDKRMNVILKWMLKENFTTAFSGANDGLAWLKRVGKSKM